tara:strand:- start:370 stop:987 length:618 start_codon:yes stop_codon:yes gene_type:complete
MSLNFANNNSLSAIDTKPSGLSGGALTLLSTQTASSSASISFTSGIDSTYKEYQFHYTDIHPANDDAYFQFNMSADSGSNYNVAKTSTFFRAFHTQTGGTSALGYLTDDDLAQGTGFQRLIEYGYNDATSSSSGILYLFDPSSTTFVKHFTAQTTYRRSYSSESHASAVIHVGGYGNTTSAIDAVQFKFASGNIDAGTIKMYGVS